MIRHPAIPPSVLRPFQVTRLQGTPAAPLRYRRCLLTYLKLTVGRHHL